jgi:hypothetical protein
MRKIRLFLMFLAVLFVMGTTHVVYAFESTYFSRNGSLLTVHTSSFMPNTVIKSVTKVLRDADWILREKEFSEQYNDNEMMCEVSVVDRENEIYAQCSVPYQARIDSRDHPEIADPREDRRRVVVDYVVVIPVSEPMDYSRIPGIIERLTSEYHMAARLLEIE